MRIPASGIALLLSASLCGTAWAAPIGTTVDVSTRVVGSGPGGNREIRPKSPIFQDDRLKANKSGNAQIILTDQTKIVVGPNAEIDIDDFAYATNNTFQSISVKATKGAFRFISGNSPSTAYKINTPSGSIGVRGTAFDVAVDGGETHVTVVRGAVEMCPANSTECERLVGWCSYGVMNRQQVDLKGQLRSRPASEKNKFPLMVDQEPLLTSFRHPGPSCADTFALIEPTPQIQTPTITPPPGAPPAPPGPAPTTPNNSGLGDGTNPGLGLGRANSPNTGTTNPSGSTGNGGPPGLNGGGPPGQG